MNSERTLSLDKVFEDDIHDSEFQKQDRLIKPYYDLVSDIINRRIDLNITQKELAKRAKTFQSRISKIESGEHDLRLSTIIQIAEALETELSIQLIPLEAIRAYEFSAVVIEKLLSTNVDELGVRVVEERTSDEAAFDKQTLSTDEQPLSRFRVSLADV